jgi:argininosuccinate lyase
LHQLSLAELKRFSRLFEKDALKIDAMSAVSTRDVPGGTAPKRVRVELRRARRRIEGYITGAKKGASRSSAAARAPKKKT